MISSKKTKQYPRYSTHPISDQCYSQALGRQRQFTTPSSKGMPNLDSTAPELTLSLHNDVDRDSETDPYHDLEDLNGFHDYITRSNRHSRNIGSAAANHHYFGDCNYPDPDYTNRSSSVNPFLLTNVPITKPTMRTTGLVLFVPPISHIIPPFPLFPPAKSSTQILHMLSPTPRKAIIYQKNPQQSLVVHLPPIRLILFPLPFLLELCTLKLSLQTMCWKD
jgi:hypothetical protein